MLIRLTHVNLWVHDHDEALVFYTRKVGFEPRQDVTLAEFGNYRYLTVGPPLQPEVHFILGVPGPPVHDPDTAGRMKGRSATLPAITSDSSRWSPERLLARAGQMADADMQLYGRHSYELFRTVFTGPSAPPGRPSHPAPDVCHRADDQCAEQRGGGRSASSTRIAQGHELRLEY